jgi:hypothetical protein
MSAVDLKNDHLEHEFREFCNLWGPALKKIEKKGREIYKRNKTLHRLANVMEHPEFREFYHLFLSDWETARVMLIFMKLYDWLENRVNIQLSPYQKLAILKNFLDDSKKRQLLFSGSVREQKHVEC